MIKETINFAHAQFDVYSTKDTKQWFMTVDEVARAYGVERTAIMNALARHPDEIRKGFELDAVTLCDTAGRRQEKTVIYRDGVIKLGFFIRGGRAKAFRQFATDLVIQHLEHIDQSSSNSFSIMMDKLDAMHFEINGKLDHLMGINLTVFGDDAPVIRDLIIEAAKIFKMTVPEYWGRVRKECDVSSYKQQNRKIINWIRNDMGKGIRLVGEVNSET